VRAIPALCAFRRHGHRRAARGLVLLLRRASTPPTLGRAGADQNTTDGHRLPKRADIRAARRSVGDIEEGGGAGRWELVGGTGEHAGVSGSCPYETEYLPGNHLVSIADCTWQK